MKFRCERDVLSEVLSVAGRAVSTGRSGHAALSGVHIRATGNSLEVTGTDLDLTMTIATEAVVMSEGVAVVPARLMTDIVKALSPGAVVVESEGSEVRVSSGKSQFAVRLLESSEFPSIAPRGPVTATLKTLELGDALRQVVRAASSDDARPVLTGVLMSSEQSGIRLVATDSYRLAVRDLPDTKVLQADQSVLVPSKALGELTRILDGESEVEVSLGEREIDFVVGKVRLTSRLIEGQFPDYRPLIPSSYPNRFTVDRDTLLEAVRRVKLVVKDATTPVRMSFRADGAELNVVSQEVGHATEDIEAKYEGEEITVAFNPAYLIDGLDVSPSGEVVIETIDALKPATITSSANSDFLYLIMPVRVS